MRRSATYLEYTKNRRRQSEKAIPVALRHDGITVDASSLALPGLALLVLILIVLLLGG